MEPETEMTTPPTFPDYKGPKPRPRQNPLIAVSALCEHALAVAVLDIREAAGKWEFSFSESTSALIAALKQCPNSEGWVPDYDAYLNTHSLPLVKGWTTPAEVTPTAAAPHNNPLILIERLRGRVLNYEAVLPDNLSRKEILGHLEAIQDNADIIYFALRQHADSQRWQSELAEYERAQHAPEQNARDRQTFATLVEAIAARQREWDRNGRLTPLYHALELGGEIGELLNVIKKQERLRLGLPGSTATDGELRGVGRCLDLHVLAGQRARRRRRGGSTQEVQCAVRTARIRDASRGVRWHSAAAASIACTTINTRRRPSR
jgi:hypothetical protein